jgi:hypothetical protein
MCAVHGLASAQSLPVEQGRQPGMGVLMQPVLELQLSVVQAFLSSQVRAAPVVHVAP